MEETPMRREPLPVLFAAGLLGLATFSPARASDDETWDGLTKVPSKRVEALYLLKGADFRTYAKVAIDPPQVSFRKDWLQDVNRGRRDPGRRISHEDAQRIQRALGEGFAKILASEFSKAGWSVVSAPAPDVLRLTPVLLNVDVQAPDKTQAGPTRTYGVQAGQAAVALEVRDAETGMLLGRAVDRKSTASLGGHLMVTDRVTNQADFEALLMAWSRIFVEGLAALKDASPLGASPDRK
jgi:hypothetical protein